MLNRHVDAVDVNRIIRTDYPSTLYCNLANEAIHAWFWQIELQRFFHKTGWIMMDDSDEHDSLSFETGPRILPTTSHCLS